MLSHLSEAMVRPILDMNGRYLVFAIAYRNPARDPDMSFPRAARWWMRDAIGFCALSAGLDVDYKLHFVESAAAFRAAWSEVNNLAVSSGRQVLYGNLLTHADKTGTRPGIQLAPSFDGDKDVTIDPRRLANLPVLPWSKSGLLIFSGCNTGLPMQGYNESLAAFAARQQGVSTIGQRGYASFSKNFDRYKETAKADPEVWLWAYRGKSNVSQPHALRHTLAPTTYRADGEFNPVYNREGRS